ncbi:ABC transporter permease [Antarcticirhabdus aurantiaca]|uniref:Iron chelate uptake ABC transporter family permease subunit n=1 Tax=Antarcticirhabdus aurantiaca TaxID=2606717 RepID=A0ACD4NNK0_9HYPH|nr:iron chelate uptake ABC transporter family permease subunit [Antarcticirhabdus aurantiaca]WAJ28469.1 iron chelate uptake ABC transporter family permease subunit [Jeongeuplla avenae]
MPTILVPALAVLGLFLVSLFVGVSDVSPATILADPQALELLLVSRLPRTIALVLAGAGMATAGLIMQMLARNRFVEPSTAGTVESASLGLLAATLLAPGMAPLGKMGVATLFALLGTGLFFAILSRVPLRSTLIVPLVGIMLGGVVSAVTTFFAYRFDLLQSLGAWATGDFSGVLRGRYELLYLSAALTLAAFLAADRFTVAGLGEAFATNLGLNYRRIMGFGLSIVAMVTAVVVVTVGAIPFLGLVVPNLVSMVVGDNVRRVAPLVALGGAGFVLACDIVGRVVRAPYEVPIGTVVGVVGSALFLAILLRRRHELG